jgi:hypothetical protein
MDETTQFYLTQVSLAAAFCVIKATFSCRVGFSDGFMCIGYCMLQVLMGLKVLFCRGDKPEIFGAFGSAHGQGGLAMG